MLKAIQDQLKWCKITIREDNTCVYIMARMGNLCIEKSVVKRFLTGSPDADKWIIDNFVKNTEREFQAHLIKCFSGVDPHEFIEVQRQIGKNWDILPQHQMYKDCWFRR